MYINFWYPVCLSDELQDKPVKVTILGLDFVAFRGSNKDAHCLSMCVFIVAGLLREAYVTKNTTPLPVHIMAGDSMVQGNAYRFPP